jgi:hypothetical protein
MAASAGVLTHAPMTLNVAFGRSYRPFNSGFVVSPDDRSWPTPALCARIVYVSNKWTCRPFLTCTDCACGPLLLQSGPCTLKLARDYKMSQVVWVHLNVERAWSGYAAAIPDEKHAF